MGKSVRQHIITKQKTIGAGASVAVDSFPFSSWLGHVEYTMTFLADSGVRKKTLKLTANKGDNSVSDRVFAKGGDNILLEIEAQKSGTDFELLVTNNELVPVDLALTRIKP